MNENETRPQQAAANVAKPYLAPTAAIELRRLLDLVADTCDAAADIVGQAGKAELARLRPVVSRIDSMVDQIKSILG